MAWTEDRVELLKKLWAEGLSASQVANRLGGCTRSSVIGKVSRLGLPGRATTSRAKVLRTAKPKQSGRQKLLMERDRMFGTVRELEGKVKGLDLAIQTLSEDSPSHKAAKPKQLADLAPVPIEGIVMPRLGRLAIITLTERTCRWPIGDPGDADFHFCRRDSPPGVPYCDHHARIAAGQ